MDIKEFKQNRVEGRKLLLGEIINTFKSLGPFAIHQFGSGVTGFKDEFSDIDVWITFKDSDIKTVLEKLNQIYKNISPVLINHHSRSWSPIGGNSSSIVHETEFGLFVVDYYISKLSETNLPKDSKILFGNDSINRGEWKINKNINNNIHDSHTIRKDINLLLDLIFISIKGIARKWSDDNFINTLKAVHKSFRGRYPGKIKRRNITLNFKSNRRLLSDFYKISNKTQRRVINKIRKYINQVDGLYFN